MKKTLLLILLAICSLSTFAEERELFPIDWKEIETKVTTMPDSVKSLVVRLSGKTLDTSLSWEERRLAVYGQSFLSENKEERLERKAEEMYNDENYKAAINNAEKALDINPLNVSALMTMAYSIAALNKAGDATYKMTDGEVYYNRAFRIYNTIATTGDGSIEHPFYVTSVPEEYSFMRYYLELWEYGSQSCLSKGGKMIDSFSLSEKSKYYSEETINFETTRSLEILEKQLKK